MATSLISTGVQFADSTIQTTAAVAGGGSAEIVASGALSDGSKVVINADGTVSVVGFAALNPPTAGTPVVFESASSSEASATYDSINNKIVIAYRDNGNSSHGTAVVGTVSGTSISFGTAVVFENSTSTNFSAVYDTANQKIVIAYTNDANSDYGTAVVGTVSGTSISFGTPVVFESVATAGTRAVTATYDEDQEKVVIAYQNGSNAFGYALIGTVSGTSISFGTPVLFNNAGSGSTHMSCTYDSTNQKVVISYRFGSQGVAIVGTVSGTSISFGSGASFSSNVTTYTATTYDTNQQKVVIAYRDEGNSNYGTAVVGTVSGTSISFGTAVVFESANTEYTAITYDPNINKVIIAYADFGNSNYGTAIVGTVSGTSISFGTPLVFESASYNAGSTAATYDPDQQKVVIAYSDGGNSFYGTATILSLTGPNLTAENYIGISDGAYADTATATIQLAGAVDDAQTSLTAGQSYFVQTDGTLGLTPDTPSVFAGTAVSSTKLIIKG
jgi:hypothetical protein